MKIEVGQQVFEMEFDQISDLLQYVVNPIKKLGNANSFLYFLSVEKCGYVVGISDRITIVASLGIGTVDGSSSVEINAFSTMLKGRKGKARMAFSKSTVTIAMSGFTGTTPCFNMAQTDADRIIHVVNPPSTGTFTLDKTCVEQLVKGMEITNLSKVLSMGDDLAATYIVVDEKLSIASFDGFHISHYSCLTKIPPVRLKVPSYATAVLKSFSSITTIVLGPKFVYFDLPKVRIAIPLLVFDENKYQAMLSIISIVPEPSLYFITDNSFIGHLDRIVSTSNNESHLILKHSSPEDIEIKYVSHNYTSSDIINVGKVRGNAEVEAKLNAVLIADLVTNVKKLQAKCKIGIIRGKFLYICLKSELYTVDLICTLSA